MDIIFLHIYNKNVIIWKIKYLHYLFICLFYKYGILEWNSIRKQKGLLYSVPFRHYFLSLFFLHEIGLSEESWLFIGGIMFSWTSLKITHSIISEIDLVGWLVHIWKGMGPTFFILFLFIITLFCLWLLSYYLTSNTMRTLGAGVEPEFFISET